MEVALFILILWAAGATGLAFAYYVEADLLRRYNKRHQDIFDNYVSAHAKYEKASTRQIIALNKQIVALNALAAVEEKEVNMWKVQNVRLRKENAALVDRQMDAIDEDTLLDLVAVWVVKESDSSQKTREDQILDRIADAINAHEAGD